jgi:pentatricopeptide repeat protein
MHCLACLPVTPNTQLSQHSKSPPNQTFPKQHLFPNNNTTIHNHISFLCKHVRIKEAIDTLSHYTTTTDNNIGPSIYGELLQGCVYARTLNLGLQIHAHIIKKGSFFTTNEFIESKLVILYAKCGVTDAAFHLFRNVVKNQNLFSWAAILGLQARTGFSKEALLSYVEMMEKGFCPDNFVVPNALKACGALKWIGFGKGVHGYVVKMNYFDDCVYVATSLVDMYGKCGVFEDAEKVFDDMPEKNVIAWNSMIAAYAQSGMNMEAVGLFKNMRFQDVEPTEVTLSGFFSASANLEAIKEGKQGHALFVKMGFELGNVLGSSIMNFYSKVGLIEEVELVFRNIMVLKDEVTWNLMISSYMQFGMFEKALEMCSWMREKNSRFDCVTLSSLLVVAADTRDVELGKKLHGFCIRNEFDSDVVLLSGVVDMYAKCGRMDCARGVFSSAKKKVIVLWNTMLAVCAEKRSEW